MARRRAPIPLAVLVMFGKPLSARTKGKETSKAPLQSLVRKYSNGECMYVRTNMDAESPVQVSGGAWQGICKHQTRHPSN